MESGLFYNCVSDSYEGLAQECKIVPDIHMEAVKSKMVKMEGDSYGCGKAMGALGQ